MKIISVVWDCEKFDAFAGGNFQLRQRHGDHKLYLLTNSGTAPGIRIYEKIFDDPQIRVWPNLWNGRSYKQFGIGLFKASVVVDPATCQNMLIPELDVSRRPAEQHAEALLWFPGSVELYDMGMRPVSGSEIEVMPGLVAVGQGDELIAKILSAKPYWRQPQETFSFKVSYYGANVLINGIPMAVKSVPSEHVKWV